MNCPICGKPLENGYCLVAHTPEEEEAAMLESVARNSIKKRFRGGWEWLEKWDHLRPTVERLRAWCEDFSADTERGWYLSGKVGTCKSGLAWAVTYELRKRGRTVAHWYIPDLLLAIKSTWEEKEGPTEASLVDDMSKADLLVLDDLGSETASDWASSIIGLVIDHRSRDCKPIMVTSNLDGENLHKHFRGLRAEQVISRMCELVEGVKMKDGDMRKAKQ